MVDIFCNLFLRFMLDIYASNKKTTLNVVFYFQITLIDDVDYVRKDIKYIY